MSESKSLVRRASDEVALMPPPPLKRIKRPPKVLDEDDYTSAVSDIIARDYFPGLRETQAQQEYLNALESNNQAWIVEAGQRLRQAATPARTPALRISRDKTFDTPQRSSGSKSTPARASDTPRGYDGSQTPLSVQDSQTPDEHEEKGELDTTNLSLSSFQSKYTSEDNESFNTLLDKQNQKRREKHAYMWTDDQRIPSARQIAYRATESLALKKKEHDEQAADEEGKALIPISTGATRDRPARPDAWKVEKPDNTFMFFASSVDEEGLQTTQNLREGASKAGPRQIVHENTRFPPLHFLDDQPIGHIPPSPSLNTDIIARRDAVRADPSDLDSMTEYEGGETPRVNGYAFVDEDEPSATTTRSSNEIPSYRDLLAGQVLENTTNPFKLSSLRKREDLHHRMVEATARKKREKDKETIKGVDNATTARDTGNMTPAARKLMEKLGRTPVNTSARRMSSREMWTPQQTPRRKTVR